MSAKDPLLYLRHMRVCSNAGSSAIAAVALLVGMPSAIAADGTSLTKPSINGLFLTSETEFGVDSEPLEVESTFQAIAQQHRSNSHTILPTNQSESEETSSNDASTLTQSPFSNDEPVDPSIDLTPDPDTIGPLPSPDVLEPLPPTFPALPTQQQPLSPDPLMQSLFGATPDFNAYRLGPGDAFFVSVRQFPDLSFQATLDIQGNIVVPLQGVVPFTGLTLQQAETLIAQIYNQYVINPDVSLTLIAQRGVEVTILGEVVRPGYYPLGAPQIATALLSAGGTTGEADLREVTIQRYSPNGEFLDEDTIDLFTPLREGQAIPNVSLQDGDVIIVERLDPAEMDEYDSTLVSRSTLAQPVITVRFLNYGSGSLGGATSGTLTAIDLPNGSRFADALVRVSLNPDTSNLGEVALVRFDEEAGRAITTTLDGHDAFRGIPAENPPLQDNDVIIVNRTALAKITYALNTFTQPFRDVLGFLLFFDQLAGSADSLFGP